MKSLSPSPGARAFAIGGAIAFAASIAYGAYAYGVIFAQAASTPFISTRAWLIDVALFAAFGVHHSLLARQSIKATVRTRLSPQVERSLYVWIASVLFFLMTWAWQPVAGVAWRVDGPLAWLIHAVQIAGGLLGIAAGRSVDVRDLAGLSQTRGLKTPGSMEPVRSGPYGVVRHPLYLAFLMLLWAVAVMTGTRLVFAVLFTAYVVMAIPFEERDLRQAFGESYGRYAGKVRYRMIPGLY